MASENINNEWTGRRINGELNNIMVTLKMACTKCKLNFCVVITALGP